MTTSIRTNALLSLWLLFFAAACEPATFEDSDTAEEIVDVDVDDAADNANSAKRDGTRVTNVLASLNTALRGARLSRGPATSKALKTAQTRIGAIVTADAVIAEGRADVVLAQTLLAQAPVDFIAVEGAIEAAWTAVHESPLYRATHGKTLSFGKTDRLKTRDGVNPWVKANVGNYKGSFAAITLRAKDNPVFLDHVRVYHLDGTFEELSLEGATMIREDKSMTLRLMQPGPIEIVKIQAGSGFVNWDHAYLEVAGVESRD